MPSPLQSPADSPFGLAPTGYAGYAACPSNGMISASTTRLTRRPTPKARANAATRPSKSRLVLLFGEPACDVEIGERFTAQAFVELRGTWHQRARGMPAQLADSEKESVRRSARLCECAWIGRRAWDCPRWFGLWKSRRFLTSVRSQQRGGKAALDFHVVGGLPCPPRRKLR